MTGLHLFERSNKKLTMQPNEMQCSRFNPGKCDFHVALRVTQLRERIGVDFSKCFFCIRHSLNFYLHCHIHTNLKEGKEECRNFKYSEGVHKNAASGLNRSQRGNLH